MKTTLYSLHRHIKAHHKKYLFGIFGGFVVVKLFLLAVGLTMVQQSVFTNAQLDTGCILTGQYYTGEYQTGCVEMPEEFSGGYLIDCQTVPGYFTGGTTNESGELVDQIWVEESQTGCVLTGQTIIPAYMTGCYMTGGYWTGGTLLCEEDSMNVMNVCTSGEVTWNGPLAGSSVRDIFAASWNYSGCVVSGVTLYLRDHNQQRISLVELDSGTTNYVFDSKSLYGFQYDGLYHIIGNTGAGNFMLYTGQYTGTYSRLYTGYKMRLLASDQTILHETASFTIDNQAPVLSAISLTSNGSTSGYLALSGIVNVSFVASELLDDVDVTLGGKQYTSSARSGLAYTYTRVVNSLYPQGPLVASLAFGDVAGNTGFVVFTGSLLFDTVIPTATGFVFTESAEGLVLAFTGSEPIQYTLNYRTSGSPYITGKNTNYLISHQAPFTGIQRNLLYTFTLDFLDRAGNSRAVTGDVMRTNLGQIVSHISVVSTSGDQLLTGNLSTLAVTLKKEVEKFNVCKDALSYTTVDVKVRRNSFLIHMPKFQKSQVKTLVNAFTLFVLDQIKGNYKITKADIEKITQRFDSFLVILKLLRDDDNSCEQNLSNYHIIQFQKALKEYNINLE